MLQLYIARVALMAMFIVIASRCYTAFPCNCQNKKIYYKNLES